MTTHFPTVPVGWALREAHLRHSECRPLALVVNDDPIIASTVSAILNGSGVAALSVTTAGAALETALLIPPQILIADLALPKMGGFDLALEITRTVTDCEVLLVAGPASIPTTIARMCSLGCDFFLLVKPVHPVDLLDGIRHLLARRGDPFGFRKPFNSRRLEDDLFAQEVPALSGSDRWVRARRRRSHTSVVN